MASAAQAFALDDETLKHMDAAIKEERDTPSEPDRPAPTVTIEREEPAAEKKAEKPAEKPAEKQEAGRARNPDGTFAKTETEKAAAAEKPAEKPQEHKAPPEGYVPHGALHEERERRKATEKRVEAMEARFQALVAKIQEKPAPQAPAAPDPNQDFPGHVQHHFNQFTQQQAELGKKVQGFEALHQQQQQEMQFMQAYQIAAQQFAARSPDFGNAYQHWLKGRLEELTDAGYSPEQALHIRSAEERGLVAKAFEDGVNPAERLYAVAKRRGYTVPSSAPAEQPAAEKPAVDPAEKLKQIEQGQRSTPSMGGGASKPRLTLKSISEMTDEEFQALDWERTMKELTP